MADRFWVGGTANWDGTAGTKWATFSGGSGGASVPTEDDDVYFDSASGSGVVTITATASAANFNTTGFTGTIAGTSTLRVDQNLTLSSGVTFSYSGTINMTDNAGTATIRTAGKTIGSLRLGGASSSATFSLQDALTMTGTLTLIGGTFTTNNFNVAAASFASSNSNTRTINLGSSTLTLSGTSNALDFDTTTNLTFNRGTSQINLSGSSTTFIGGGQTFYNVAFTNTGGGTINIISANTFNNLSVTGCTSAGVKKVNLFLNQTVNGTLTLSAGTDATMRTFVCSANFGLSWTLTVNSFAVGSADIDFRDITVTGAAAPISGTRFGDCKGNSGITFPAGKTVYWNLSAGGNWGGAIGWATSSGGSPAINNFPLAQDTCVFESTGLNSGATITINAEYNVGTIDMSARTGNTMTLANGTVISTVYGNWINGTGVTLSGTGAINFSGRGSQTITSAGRTFTQSVGINTPGGSVTLQDALVSSRATISAISLEAGTLNDGGYNITASSTSFGGIQITGNDVKTAVINGTWTAAGSGNAFVVSMTPPTVTGTGTISLTNSAAKTFAGGNVQTYPTISQGGTGNLTITGSNKFIGITNTALGRIQFTGGTTQEFTNFNLNGIGGNRIQIGSTNTTQVTLRKPSAWLVGANSIDGGNNTGLSFAGTSPDYLDISYINGVNTAPSTGNFFMLF